MKKLIILVLCLVSGSILQGGNTHSGLAIASEEPVLSDEQLLDGLHTAVQANDPTRVYDMLLIMSNQNRLHKLIDRYITSIGNDETNRMIPCSAIQLAAYYGYEIIVDLLLEWGASVNGPSVEDPHSQVNDLVLTPLQLAAKGGHSLVIQRLLQNNAHPNLNDNPKISESALNSAIKNHCSADSIKMLLANHAKIFMVWGNVHSALHVASSASNEVATLIILDALGQKYRSSVVNFINRDGETPLHCAAKVGCCPIIKLLLDNGAHIHAVNDHWHTPLMLAQANGHLDAVNLLIARGATH